MEFPQLIRALIVLAALPAAMAPAATVSLARSTREVTPEEIAGGAPAGGYVHDFFLTSDTDLLSFSDIKVDVPLFHDLLGSDVGPSAAALAADSYLATPGSTIVLGGGFADTGGGALWGDLSNDGAQQGFHFARLTTGQTGSFTGRVAVRGYDAPVYLPFDFALPGSAADLSLLAAEPTYSLEYSTDPPPPPPAPPITPPTPPVTPPAPPAPPATPPAPPVEPPANPDPPANPLLARLSLTRQSRLVTPEEVAGGAPAGGYVHEFFVTTATDILSINSINVDAPLFQDAYGSNAGPAPSDLAIVSSSITADSFIDTPGDTLTLGSEWTGGDGLRGDLSNDGAQEDFLFARLTVAETGTFAGQIDVRHEDAFVSLPFEFLLPGNEQDMALLAGEQTYAMDFPPTPPPVETPPVYTPPIEGPAPPPIDEPYTPPTGPIEPPLVTYPPFEGYPIVDPPSGLPIDPVEPVDPPSEPSQPGDVDDLVDVVPPTEQPPTSENPPDPTAPPDADEGIFTWRPELGIIRPWGEIDVTLPVDWEPLVFTHYYYFNGSIDVTTAYGMVEFTTIDLTTFDGPGRMVAFDADGVVTQGVLFSTTSGQTVALVAGQSLIPEPSAGILALTAAFGMIATHRRGRA